MSVTAGEIKEASVLIGPQFSEPMRVIGSPGGGDSFVIVNLVGTRTHTFRGGVTLTKQDLQSLPDRKAAQAFRWAGASVQARP